MKAKLFKNSTLVLMSLFVSHACSVFKKDAQVTAEDKQINENTLFWEVSGNGLEHPAYLYGTIHIQDKKVFAFDPVVMEKFDEVEAFAMEIVVRPEDMDSIKTLQLLPEGKTIKDLMSEEEYEMLAEKFQKRTGSHIVMYQRVKPFFIAAAYGQAGMPKDMPQALDHYLQAKATEEGKEVIGIESILDQLHAIDRAMSYQEQADELIESVKKDDSVLTNSMARTLRLYLSGDIDHMAAMQKRDSTISEQIVQEMIVKRNYHMADRLDEIFQSHHTFAAVGAAHLGGPEGVLEILRQKGYEVKAIPIEFREPE
jgi:uncharacterized protein